MQTITIYFETPEMKTQFMEWLKVAGRDRYYEDMLYSNHPTVDFFFEEFNKQDSLYVKENGDKFAQTN